MEKILLHGITPDELYEKIRLITREELKAQLDQDQLLTKGGCLKDGRYQQCYFFESDKRRNCKTSIGKG
ncbi:MAG TPA: hypothetical protein VNS32_28835 [Flavisolibacter sp.]|nr:hypothetical protein [Flavisolibacter sp.]